MLRTLLFVVVVEPEKRLQDSVAGAQGLDFAGPSVFNALDSIH